MEGPRVSTTCRALLEKLLRAHALGRRKRLAQILEHRLHALEASGGAAREPEVRPHEIFFDAASVEVAGAETRMRHGLTLLRREPLPTRGFGIVLRNPATRGEHHAEPELAGR